MAFYLVNEGGYGARCVASSSREAGVEWWRGFKERNLKSELQSFEPLRCSVCIVSIKLSRADFLECLKCSQFVCASCLLLPDKTMCKKC